MAVTKAVSNELPIGTRAVLIKFKTDKGACSVTYDRHGMNSSQFTTLEQMMSNAIGSVLADGRKIDDYTVYLVD